MGKTQQCKDKHGTVMVKMGLRLVQMGHSEPYNQADVLLLIHLRYNKLAREWTEKYAML